jgi:hypothetical protein
MITKIKLFIILSVSFISVSYGQNTTYQHLDTLVNDYVKKLQANNIDTICIYKNYCVGCVYIFDNENDRCNYSSIYMPTYILWYKQGTTYLTKKDNCFDYSTIQINSIGLWKLFFKNKQHIQKEKVKLFEYISHENHKKEKYFIMRDHSNHQDFKMLIKEEIIALNFDEFDLEKECDEHKNINYLHNKNLKGKIIIDELENLTQKIEKEKLLIKNRR